MAKNGCFNIDRKLKHWGWWHNPLMVKAWVWMLGEARWKDTEWMGNKIMRGEFYMTYPIMTKELQISIQQARTIFSNLKSTGEITAKIIKKGQIVRIVKYESYQLATGFVTDKQQHYNKVNKETVSCIVEYLSEKSGKKYRPTTKQTVDIITARLNDGFTVENFKTVIDNQCYAWKGTEYEKYLRPATLFQGGKFEGYLNNTHQGEWEEVVI